MKMDFLVIHHFLSFYLLYLLISTFFSSYFTIPTTTNNSFKYPTTQSNIFLCSILHHHLHRHLHLILPLLIFHLIKFDFRRYCHIHYYSLHPNPFHLHLIQIFKAIIAFILNLNYFFTELKFFYSYLA
jgi:hypothetical protein